MDPVKKLEREGGGAYGVDPVLEKSVPKKLHVLPFYQGNKISHGFYTLPPKEEISIFCVKI